MLALCSLKIFQSRFCFSKELEITFEDIGLKMEDEEMEAGDFNFAVASKFNCRLTTLEGNGRTNLNVSSLTGVTKGVVSGVASIAASGGDSMFNFVFWILLSIAVEA